MTVSRENLQLHAGGAQDFKMQCVGTIIGRQKSSQLVRREKSLWKDCCRIVAFLPDVEKLEKNLFRSRYDNWCRFIVNQRPVKLKSFASVIFHFFDKVAIKIVEPTRPTGSRSETNTTVSYTHLTLPTIYSV